MDINALAANDMFHFAQAQASTSRLKGVSERGTIDHRAAREAAEELEGVFINTLIETMFSSVETDGPFGGGHSEEVFRSMMNEQYAKSIAQSGGIGLADNIYREILKLQEQAD